MLLNPVGQFTRRITAPTPRPINNEHNTPVQSFRKFYFLCRILFTLYTLPPYLPTASGVTPTLPTSIETRVEVTPHANGIQPMHTLRLLLLRCNWLRKEFNLLIARQFMLHHPSLDQFVELVGGAAALELNGTFRAADLIGTEWQGGEFALLAEWTEKRWPVVEQVVVLAFQFFECPAVGGKGKFLR